MAVVVGEGAFVIRTIFDKQINFEQLSSEFKKNFDQATQTLDQFEQRFLDVQKTISLGLVPQEAANPFLESQLDSLRQLGGESAALTAQARAVQQLQAQYNLLNRTLVDSAEKTAVLNRLQAQARTLGGDLTRGLNNITETGSRASGIFGFIGRAAAKADEVLEGFGLTMRDINVVLGSGFLSTAGPALALLLGVTIVTAAAKAFVALSRLGAEIQSFRDRLQAGFGQGAQIIEEFAQGSAQNFGLTEKAAIELTGTIGNLFQSFGIGQELSAQFGVDLASAARIIQRTSFTTDTYEQVLSKLKGGLTGNVEALREYGIAVNETSLRETARAHSIQLIAGEMDAATKALLSYLFITDQANQRQDEFNKTTEGTLTEQEKLTAAWEELKTAIGEDLTPLFHDLIVIGQGVVNFLGDLYDGVKATLGPLADLSASISDILNLPEIGDMIFGSDSEEAFSRFAQGIGAINEEVRAFGGLLLFGPSAQEQVDEFREKTNQLFDDFVKGKVTADQFFTILAAGLDISPQEAQRQYEAFFNVLVRERPELEKYREELFNTTFAQKEAEEAARAHQEELRNQPEFLRRLVDAYKNLNDVIEDNAERLKDARADIKDARADKIESIRDAEADLKEAREDRKKDVLRAEEDLKEAEADRIKAIDKAERDLKEAREDREKAIADARDALKDAKEEEREQIADAEEALRDARIDAARRVDDAEEKLADARRQRARELFDAALGLEQALRRGDVFAERSAALALSRARTNRSVVDAKLALEEARLEATEKIAEAQEKLAEVIEDSAERVEDAREKLSETIEEQDERVKEASERLTETIEEQDERVAESGERLAEIREKTLERILDMEDKLEEVEHRANERLKEARERLREVREENAKRLKEAIDRVDELEGKWHDVNDEVAHLRRQLTDLISKYRQLTGDPLEPNAVTGGVVNNDQQFGQHGGHFRAGRPVIVGEVGPELFIPNSSGTVVTNRQLMEALRQMTQHGSGGSNSFVIQDSRDPEATAFMVQHRIMSGVNN